MNNLICSYINKMQKEDIIKFAKKNNLVVSDAEIDFVYSFIKNHHQEVLKNPDSFDITLYKNQFSNDNYLFIKNLIDKYKRMI